MVDLQRIQFGRVSMNSMEDQDFIATAASGASKCCVVGHGHDALRHG